MTAYPDNSILAPAGAHALRFACQGCGTIGNSYCCDGKGNALPARITVDGAPTTLDAFFDEHARGDLTLDEINAIIGGLARQGFAKIAGFEIRAVRDGREAA